MFKRPNSRGYRPHHPYRLDESGKVKRLYRIWIEIRSRCTNPKRINYSSYKGKGVTVCPEWFEYINFHTDMADSYSAHVKLHGEKKTTLDRIDNNGGYSKANCRWATPKRQNNNTSTNVLVTYQGTTKTVAEWSEFLGLRYTTLWCRLFVYKHPLEKAMRRLERVKNT